MNIHVDLKNEGRRRQGVFQAAIGAMRSLPPERFGVPVITKSVPNSRYLNSPAFDPSNAPTDATFVDLLQLEFGECHWPVSNGKPHLFCGLPVDPTLSACKTRRHYCAHHAALATSRDGAS